MKRKLLSQYNSLEEITAYLKTKTDLKVSVVNDGWHTDDSITRIPRGKKCILIKKNASTGVKVDLLESSIVDIHPVAPSGYLTTMMTGGRGIFFYILNLIARAIMSGPQKKLAEEIENYLIEIQDS